MTRYVYFPSHYRLVDSARLGLLDSCRADTVIYRLLSNTVQAQEMVRLLHYLKVQNVPVSLTRMLLCSLRSLAVDKNARNLVRSSRWVNSVSRSTRRTRRLSSRKSSVSGVVSVSRSTSSFSLVFSDCV